MSEVTYTEDVFGVKKNILTYVTRYNVDNKFKNALRTDKQIIVYGASKQGKTALVSKYCGYDKNIVFQITPETDLTDIYSSILSRAGVVVRTEFSEGTGVRSSRKMQAKIVATFASILKTSGSIGSEYQNNKEKNEKFTEIPFNITQPQDIYELLNTANNDKIIILENFHYLNSELQKKFAFDLRSFQDLGVKFIILGVWREKNRLSQFNGDLLDRIEEIPVEPWTYKDFYKIIIKGEKLLNIEISKYIFHACCESSFASVGVFQDLIKSTCLNSRVTERKEHKLLINNCDNLELSIEEKAESYSDRHLMALRAIASDGTDTILNLPYYIVQAILCRGVLGMSNGVSLEVLYEEIAKMHFRSTKLNIKDVRNALNSLKSIQVKKEISPPIIAYNDNSKLLQIVDSTLYFFLQNTNTKKFSKELEGLYSQI